MCILHMWPIMCPSTFPFEFFPELLFLAIVIVIIIIEIFTFHRELFILSTYFVTVVQRKKNMSININEYPTIFQLNCENPYYHWNSLRNMFFERNKKMELEKSFISILFLILYIFYFTSSFVKSLVKLSSKLCSKFNYGLVCLVVLKFK